MATDLGLQWFGWREKNYTLGHHLVAFLDVLAQRERFRQLELPKTPEDHARVEQGLKDTASFVSALNIFMSFSVSSHKFSPSYEVPSLCAPS